MKTKGILMTAVVACVLWLHAHEAQAFYNPSTGRWLSRDPIEEVGGVNLAGFSHNDGVNRFDKDGRFYVWVHQAITEDALDLFNQKNGISSGCAYAVTRILDSAVVEQDVKAFDDLRRHYNRDLVYDLPSKIAADNAYQTYLDIETRRFNGLLKLKKCRASLFSLGLLTHSWQDFYAHAIRRDGMGGYEDSNFPGWLAFYVGITGNPESRGNFWPSSYSLHAEGEHPSKHEPVLPYTAEGQARKREALIFTYKKYTTLLRQWHSVCQCSCDTGGLWFEE